MLFCNDKKYKKIIFLKKSKLFEIIISVDTIDHLVLYTKFETLLTIIPTYWCIVRVQPITQYSYYALMHSVFFV